MNNQAARPNSTHDKVIRLEEWRRGHEATHDHVGEEVKELRNSLNRLLLAVIGLMGTVAGTAIFFALSRLE